MGNIGKMKKVKKVKKVPVRQVEREKILSYIEGRCVGIKDGFKISRMKPKMFTILLHKGEEGIYCGVNIEKSEEEIKTDFEKKTVISYVIYTLQDNKYVLTCAVNMPQGILKEIEMGKIII